MIHVPPVLVLIVCKVALVAGEPDQNAEQTGHQNLEWATVGSMMTCRRSEVQLYDPAEGATAAPLNPDLARGEQCARAGIQMGTTWDQAHLSSPWRVWRVGCPSPIIDSQTGIVIGYKLPECSHRDTVVCEVDSAI